MSVAAQPYCKTMEQHWRANRRRNIASWWLLHHYEKTDSEDLDARACHVIPPGSVVFVQVRAVEPSASLWISRTLRSRVSLEVFCTFLPTEQSGVLSLHKSIDPDARASRCHRVRALTGISLCVTLPHESSTRTMNCGSSVPVVGLEVRLNPYGRW
jgi:hypothetical protein